MPAMSCPAMAAMGGRWSSGFTKMKNRPWFDAMNWEFPVIVKFMRTFGLSCSVWSAWSCNACICWERTPPSR